MQTSVIFYIGLMLMLLSHPTQSSGDGIPPSLSAESEAGKKSELLPMTYTRLQKIIDLAQKSGDERLFNIKLASALGFPNGPTRLRVQQIILDINPGEIVFSQPKGGITDYIFGAIINKDVFVYRVSKDMKLITGVQKLKDHEVEQLSFDDAMKSLDVIYDRWARCVDVESSKPISGP